MARWKPPDPADPSGWDWYRWKTVGVHAKDLGTPPDELLDRKRDLEALHEALEKLDPVDREVLVGRAFEDLTFRQIGERLKGRHHPKTASPPARGKRIGTSVERLRQREAQAMAQIRHHMETRCPYEVAEQTARKEAKAALERERWRAEQKRRKELKAHWTTAEVIRFEPVQAPRKKIGRVRPTVEAPTAEDMLHVKGEGDRYLGVWTVKYNRHVVRLESRFWTLVGFNNHEARSWRDGAMWTLEAWENG